MQEHETKLLLGEMDHLLRAIRISLEQGGRFLASRCAPNGPIMREPLLSYIHKATWGMFAAGVEYSLIAQLLDWAEVHALQSNGDFYIPGERPEYRDMQRAYRPLTFGKIAAWIGHPLVQNGRVVDRLLQYQHASGGVFNYIGDDPKCIEEQPSIGTLDTSFFGHLMIALDRPAEATRAGDWLCQFIEANRPYMDEQALMYTQMTPQGELITSVGPGERMGKVVDNRTLKQQFWQPGTVMAYLAALYEAMKDRWGYTETEVDGYLGAALTALAFEATMPLDTYLWPSKCKVGWGAGELLRVLVKYDKGTQAQRIQAYRAARNVAIFTFIDNQLPTGGWSCMHYPLSELAPEYAFDYKPIKGLVNVPDRRIPGSQTIFLPGEEITGEFLGEMKAIQTGIEALRDHLTCSTGSLDKE